MNLNQFENKYQNPFDVNSFLKMICFTKQRFPKDFGFPNLPQKTNPTLKYNYDDQFVNLYSHEGKVTMSVGSQVS